MGATYMDSDGLHHTYPKGHDLPLDITGARTKGRVFGSRRDHTDLVAPAFTDWLCDVGLAAVSRLIDPASSAAIGTAGHNDFALTYDLLRRIQDDRRAVSSGAHETLEIYRDALLFVLHRRRVYTGADDDFVSVAAFAWITLAQDVTAGAKPSPDLLPSDGSILDGDYRRRRLGLR